MTSLKKDFWNYIFATMSDQDFMRALKQIKYSDLKQKGLIDKRSTSQMDQKQLQRNNAYRFAEGFKITKKLKNQQSAFRQLEFIVNSYGFGLNTNAFLVSIQLLGDEEQVQYWRKQVLSGKAIGCYGQTELGHGSNVKELQTTAIYDEQKGVFIIDSPKPTSAKFWPGLLGNWSTHAVIQAKTIVKGKNIGVQTFVIQIRNEKLQTLPNIQLFDIGPKLGFDKVDNGGAQFHKVQIPRKAMLMKYVKIQKDGTVVGLENKSAIKYGYGSMLNLRVKLTYSFSISGIIMPTICLHDVLKRQGLEKSQNNRKMITDLLCLGFGTIIANKNTQHLFQLFLKNIREKNFQKADENLIDCHIISATSKALSSRIAIDTFVNSITYNDIAKFKTTRLPGYFVDYIPGATYEGDNTVLLQQTAKYLLFKFNTQKDFAKISFNFKSTDWKSAADALQFIISKRLKALKQKISVYTQKNVKFKVIWNEMEQVNLINLSTLWGIMTFLRSAGKISSSIQKNQQFYRKICEGFTNFYVSRRPEFAIEGFFVESIEVWKAFTDEQYQVMIELETPIESQFQPLQFVSRGDWFKAKL